MPRLYLSPSFQINCLTKNPRVFTARLKPPAAGDSCLCRAGARAGAASQGHGPSRGGCSQQETHTHTPPLQGTGTSLTLCFWTGIASKAILHCRGVFAVMCNLCRPSSLLLSSPPIASPSPASILQTPQHIHAFLTCFWGTNHQPEAASYPPAVLHSQESHPL